MALALTLGPEAQLLLLLLVAHVTGMTAAVTGTGTGTRGNPMTAGTFCCRRHHSLAVKGIGFPLAGLLQILFAANVATVYATMNGFQQFLWQVVLAVVSAAIAGVAAVVAIVAVVAICIFS